MTMHPADASVVIAPYLEPVVRGRRVAVIGDATRPLGPALLERGARLVHVYDPDAARVAEVLARRGSSRTLMTAPLPEGDVAVRDGAFDAVVVPDLTLFDPVDTVVARARKLVANHGHAIFVSPNPDMHPGSREGLLTYYELYDVIALQFPEVRMLGQAPFSGYVIADFAPEGDPDVVVDTSLVDQKAQEPRWFMALGTHQPRRLDPYTIIQVPGDVGVVDVDSTGEPGMRQRIDSLEQALKEARDAVPIVPRVPVPSERVEALEASLREREEELRRAESRAGDNHVRAGQLENKVRDLEQELRHQRDRAFRLSNDLEEEKKQRTKAELELRMVRSKSDLPPALDPNARAETERLRAALLQAEQQIVTLESQLATAHARLADVERDLASVRDELDDVRAAKKQADARVIELQREVEGRDARIEELDAIVVDLQEASGDPALERALEEARREQEALQASLEAALAHPDNESLVRRERDEAYRMIEQVRTEQGRVVAGLAQERDVARTSLEVALAKLADKDRELAVLHAQVEELGASAGKVSEQALEELRRERDEALAAIEVLRQEQEHDVGALERTLQERGREVQSLRRDVAHHERLARELLGRLEGVDLSAGAPKTDEEIRRRLEELMAELARREGELQQARWRIGELEHRVRDQEPVEASTEVAELEQALFAAQSEKDALRQALAAEREARLLAEAGVREGLGDRMADEQEKAVLEASLEEAGVETAAESVEEPQQMPAGAEAAPSEGEPTPEETG
jgi:chromosome segregation ATPase